MKEYLTDTLSVDDLLRDVKSHAGQLNIILDILKQRGAELNGYGVVQSYSNIVEAIIKSHCTGAMPLCPVHKRLEESDNLEVEIGGLNCVACSLNERSEMLKVLAPLAPPDHSLDSIGVLRSAIGYLGAGNPWADFLHHRKRVLHYFHEQDNESPAQLAKLLSMDEGQASLILHSANDDAEIAAEYDRMLIRAKAHCTPAGDLVGVEIITIERRRQIEKERWTPEHDAEHVNGELAQAAACYAWPPPRPLPVKKAWPWDRKWWKPTIPDEWNNTDGTVKAASCQAARIRDLAKAGALIAAEIDRLLRSEKP